MTASIPRRFFPALLLCASVALALYGCCHHDDPGCASVTAAAASAPAATETFVKTELYFGLSKPGGLISEDEWVRFVDQHITPSFSDGLTVLDAKGQWKNQAGQITKESTKLVILIHKPSHENDSAIDAIISAYKKLFQQESVLRALQPQPPFHSDLTGPVAYLPDVQITGLRCVAAKSPGFVSGSKPFLSFSCAAFFGSATRTYPHPCK